MTFIDITTANQDLKESVLSWRNHIDIRKNMYTDDIITIQNHVAWLDALKKSNTIKVYVAYKDDKAIGVVSINNINNLHKNADWAFYLNPDFLHTKGLGTLMEYHFLNYIFDNFNIEKLN